MSKALDIFKPKMPAPQQKVEAPAPVPVKDESMMERARKRAMADRQKAGGVQSTYNNYTGRDAEKLGG
jgi:hypothetical protein